MSRQIKDPISGSWLTTAGYDAIDNALDPNSRNPVENRVVYAAIAAIHQMYDYVEVESDGQAADAKCLYSKRGKYVYVYAWVHKTASSWTIFSSLPKPQTADVRLCNAVKLSGTDTELGTLGVYISSTGSLQIKTTGTSDNIYIASGWYVTSD